MTQAIHQRFQSSAVRILLKFLMLAVQTMAVFS